MEENTTEVKMGWQSDNTLSESLAFMLQNELWTDVTFTFKSQEGVIQVKGHTVILAARSPVFQAMFYGRIDSKREVEIEDASPESFQLFLKCLYTDDVDLDENSLISVIEIAHKYQAGYLLDLCSEELGKIISVENACQMLNLAVFYNLNKLQQTACDFIDDNADKILETPGFKNISVETLRVILAGDTFYADELRIFRKCMDWAEKKCKELSLVPDDENKRKIFGDAFFFLRLPTLSHLDFTENVAKTKLLSLEESHKVYMYKGSPSLKIDLTNSIIKRKPKVGVICLPEKKMEIEFRCPDDILLLGVMVNQSRTLSRGYVRCSYNRSMSNSQLDPANNVCAIALQGNIVIEGTDLDRTFKMSHCSKLPVSLDFEKTLLLKGRDEPYKIAVEFSLYTSYNAQYLELFRDMCEMENFRRLKNVLSEPWPCSEYRHFITGVLYRNSSNRESDVLNS
ncbi:hypothetical protein ACJMK2_025844 [Sinanodonta woodiana]|uniref:BTB domain-containing protein n=1 Tax=Sinanodonta woodiana TaxID=1069815 RepID=A0ABD3XI98_SINWO